MGTEQSTWEWSTFATRQLRCCRGVTLRHAMEGAEQQGPNNLRNLFGDLHSHSSAPSTLQSAHPRAPPPYAKGG